MARRPPNLLLDTHVFLWWRAAEPELPEPARAAIADADIVFVSAASAWEAGIKEAFGRLELPDRFAAGVEGSGFQQLPITFEHARVAADLPSHHRDPFDRMLVAQAIDERLALVSGDPRLRPYAVELLWD